MRLFVALPVPQDVRARLASALDGLDRRYPDLRWTRPDGWHVTLAFLGEVADAIVDDVVTAVGEVMAADAPPAPALRLGAPGSFGRSTAWLAVEDDPSGVVAAVGERLQDALADVVDPHRREVHPHLTLARTRRRGRLPRHLLDDLPRVEAAWPVHEVVVYRSQLGPGGSVYESVGRSLWPG